jgi:putative NADPH-quinone reductase
MLDLYAQGFDPRLTAFERQNHYADSYSVGPDIADHIEKLQHAQRLVLVFPTWWFGPPAILKGWIDRVFAPGAAFDHSPNFGPITPLLTRLEQVVVVTTLGSPWWIDWLVMRMPVRRVLKTGVFRACAPQARFGYLALYSAERADKQRVAAFERRVELAIG